MKLYRFKENKAEALIYNQNERSLDVIEPDKIDKSGLRCDVLCTNNHADFEHFIELKNTEQAKAVYQLLETIKNYSKYEKESRQAVIVYYKEVWPDFVSDLQVAQRKFNRETRGTKLRSVKTPFNLRIE